jgi:hypothetical protein
MPGGSGSSSRPSAPSNPVANVATAAGPTIVKPPPPIALQLCIETGKYSLELSALNSSAATSDGAVFARIREQYERTRRSILPMWARFKKPDKAIFVKVRIHITSTCHLYLPNLNDCSSPLENDRSFPSSPAPSKLHRSPRPQRSRIITTTALVRWTHRPWIAAPSSTTFMPRKHCTPT